MAEDDLRSYPWRRRYSTSSNKAGQKPLNIPEDFYNPALKRSIRYDRMAGFFTSTSLAAAAEGFSEFFSNHGKMRLICGCDIDPQDAEMILKGNEAKINDAFTEQFVDISEIPMNSSWALSMLFNMIAADRLEIRVAFRRDETTGKIIDFNSRQNGYVHEKWAVFEDAYGNRMGIEGSLNESKTAFELNAESFSLCWDWIGDGKERLDDYEEDFELCWTDKNPSLKVMKIPEAVKRKLISLAPRLRERYLKLHDAMSSTEEQIKRVTAAIIKDAPFMPHGEYVGIETCPITPWPHQLEVAHQLIDNWPQGAMLCDEVGLGKTIEAGLAIRSLLLSGKVHRVLILAPAGLCSQWQNELKSKFELDFARIKVKNHQYQKTFLREEKDSLGPELLAEPLTIMSTGLFKLENHFQKLLEEIENGRKPDLVLIDEAHYARRKMPDQPMPEYVRPEFGDLYKNIAQLAKRMDYRQMWLATATPMQLNWIEAWDLMRLLRGTGWYDTDPSLMSSYYDALSAYCSDPAKDVPWQTHLLACTKRNLEQTDTRWAKYEEVRRDETTDFLKGQFKRNNKFTHHSLAPVFTNIAPLSQVMIRHTRPLLEAYKKAGLLTAGLAKRKVTTPWPLLEMSPEYKAVTEALELYCEHLSDYAAEGGETRQAVISFIKTCLLVRFASCSYSLKMTVMRKLEKVENALYAAPASSDVLKYEELPSLDMEQTGEEDEDVVQYVPESFKGRSKESLRAEIKELKGILELIEKEQGSDDGKLKALLKALEGRQLPKHGRFKQTVIFTKFFDTLDYIRSRLNAKINGAHLGVYSGSECSWSDGKRRCDADRDEVKRRFLSGDIDILLCTDAAAEGLNLQCADLLINYDLPWNPMKLEQRIGRIDRIGQIYDEVTVLNLYYSGSVEEDIYVTLLKRLEGAITTVGSQRPSILPITEEDFIAIANKEKTYEQVVKEAKERLATMQKWRSIEEPDPRVVMDRFKEQKKLWEMSPVPVSNSDLGKVISLIKAGDEVVFTADPEVLNRGIEGKETHFFTYGDPLFDEWLNRCTKEVLPRWCRRIEYESNGEKAIGYAVAGKNGVRLVCALRDLHADELDTEHLVTDEELKAPRQMLEKHLHEKAAKAQIHNRDLKLKKDSAKAQEALEVAIAEALLRTFEQFDKGAASMPFSEVERWLQKAVNNALGDNNTGIHCQQIDPNAKKKVAGSSYSVSSDRTISVPVYVAWSALAKMKREFDGSRKKQLTVGNVHQRMRELL